MKNFKIEKRGTLPMYVSTLVETYSNKPVSKEAINQLDSDIEFCVVELKEAHGNCYKNEAWLCPANGDNSFNVRIYF